MKGSRGRSASDEKIKDRAAFSKAIVAPTHSMSALPEATSNRTGDDLLDCSR